jgi:catechol 2,3-dioxygenase-like lactoylglutathione lyase family enzyme
LGLPAAQFTSGCERSLRARSIERTAAMAGAGNMIDHIGLKVKDLDASVRFYKEVLAPLGYELGFNDENVAGFGPKGAPALWLYADETLSHSLLHLAFSASSRAAVDAFHKAGLKARGRDNGAPGLRQDYSPTYYAAFLFDPDGNNIEAVCQK